MKNNDVIFRLKQEAEREANSKRVRKVCKDAYDLLVNEKGMKPIFRHIPFSDVTEATCPRCGYLLSTDSATCEDCGTRIDWTKL